MITRYLLATLAGILFLPALSQQTNETADIGGTSRTYVQYLPTGFDSNTESLPVVFVLHGIGDVATNMANIGTNLIADTARFIVIYPQGIPNNFGQNSWANGTLLASAADDIGLFNHLIDDMILNKNADPTRIYFTGFSMGAIMSHSMACTLNDRIAAIGTMSGTMSTNDIGACNPAYKTPVIHFHGTADGTVPYDASPLPSLSLVPETINFWRGVHGCDAAADSTQIPDTANDGITVDRFVYNNCTPLESVELWRMNGGDHTYFYQPQNDFTEAIEIWRFFSQWQHSNPATASVGSLNANSTKLYPNPTDGMVTIEVDTSEKIEVLNTNGQQITQQQLAVGENQIDLSELSPGIYLVKFSNGSTKLVTRK